MIQRIRQRISGIDRQFLTGSTVLTVGIALARILGFGFSMILTRKLTQADFGIVQYSITLAGIVAIGTQPFAQHVLARFISQYSGDRDQLTRFLNTAWLLILAIIALTFLLSAPILSAMGYFNIGVLTIFIGSTAFYVYYGAARGFIASYRLLAAYLGSNIVQLVAIFLLYYVFDATTPTPAILVYGLSYFLPLIVLQIFYPLPINVRFKLPSLKEVRELARFSTPFWLSHVAYILTAALDILFLENFWGHATVGAYALTKTLTTLFNFISIGITTMLMPKIAAMPKEQHKGMLINALALALAANGAALVAFMVGYSWFVGTFFRGDYVLDLGLVLIMALSEIIYVVHGVITAAIVGGYNPRLETVSRGIILASTFGFGVILIPSLGMGGAALTNLICAIIAVGTYGVAVLIRQKRPAPLVEPGM